VAYAGKSDYGLDMDGARKDVSAGGTLLTITGQEGYHFSVLPESFELYLAQIKKDWSEKK
jgi:hypothetical protein